VTVVSAGPGKTVAWAVERPRDIRHKTAGSVESGVVMPTMMPMTDAAVKTLACGCDVRTYRDFLQRVVGTIVTKGRECPAVEHEAGRTIIMPGRENARPE
jgi:hypothetical protein